ncbi:MAG: hypothetical protein EOO88_56335 [Pedobacter sp.]|nr:MAG: hypothetical protein EOO88_56335 [Pedobacter sp.]
MYNILSNSFNLLQATNCLLRNNGISNINLNISNSYVSNNIFLNSNLSAVNSTVKYNIATNNILPAGNNNQNNVPASSLFFTGGSTDASWQIKPGSPASGAGEPLGGITPDIGAFGTATPYRLSGIPPIPTIYELTVPASVPTTATTMSITLSTRSN